MAYFLHIGTRLLNTVWRQICFFWGQSRTHCTVCLQEVKKVVRKMDFNLPKKKAKTNFLTWLVIIIEDSWSRL